MTTTTPEVKELIAPILNKTKRKFYKVVGADMQSIHGGSYIYTLGEWTEDRSALGRNRDTYWVTTEPMSYYKLGCRIFTVEISGMEYTRGNQGSKDEAVKRVRLLEEVTETVIPRGVRKSEESAIQIISQILDARKNLDEKKPYPDNWSVQDNIDQCKSIAPWQWGDIYRQECNQRISKGPTRGAISTIANAIEDKVGKTDGRVLGQDLELYLHLLQRSPMAQEYMPIVYRHIMRRMEVWLRGYGLFGHFDDLFYVYRKV